MRQRRRQADGGRSPPIAHAVAVAVRAAGGMPAARVGAANAGSDLTCWWRPRRACQHSRVSTDVVVRLLRVAGASVPHFVLLREPAWGLNRPWICAAPPVPLLLVDLRVWSSSFKLGGSHG